MNYQYYADTSDVDDETHRPFRNPLSKSAFPKSTESGYAILFVDQDGHNKLLYAPSFHDVSSAHTDGRYDAVCPSLSKRSLFSGITIDHDLVQKSAEIFVDVFLKDLEADAATAVWYPLVRKKKPDEFLPFREYGAFEVREAEVQKLELHPALDD